MSQVHTLTNKERFEKAEKIRNEMESSNNQCGFSTFYLSFLEDVRGYPFVIRLGSSLAFHPTHRLRAHIGI